MSVLVGDSPSPIHVSGQTLIDRICNAPIRRTQNRVCSVDSCETILTQRGRLCRKHAARKWRHGDPSKTLIDMDSTPEEKFWKCVDKNGPVHSELKSHCWLWTRGVNSAGYGKFTAQGVTYYAHIFSFYLANGEWAKTCVLHKCDTPACVNPQHLWDGTKAENTHDMVAKLRHAHGEDFCHAKLKKADVALVRSMIANRMSDRAIARLFHIAPQTIGHIRLGSTWKSVPTNPVADPLMEYAQRYLAGISDNESLEDYAEQVANDLQNRRMKNEVKSLIRKLHKQVNHIHG